MGRRGGGSWAMVKPLPCVLVLLLICLATVNCASVDGVSNDGRQLQRQNARKFLNFELPSSIGNVVAHFVSPHTEEKSLDARAVVSESNPVGLEDAIESSAFQTSITRIMTEVVDQYMKSDDVTELDSEDTCADVLEEQVEIVVESLKSALRAQLCNVDVASSGREEQRFCNVLNGYPLMATLDVFSRTAVNPLETSWLRTVNTPVCQGVQLSDFVDSLDELEVLVDEVSIAPMKKYHDEHHKWGMFHGEKRVQGDHVRHMWQRLFHKLRVEKHSHFKTKHEENFGADVLHGKGRPLSFGENQNLYLEDLGVDMCPEKGQPMSTGASQNLHEEDLGVDKFQKFRLGKATTSEVEEENHEKHDLEGKHGKCLKKSQKLRLGKPVESEVGPPRKPEKHDFKKGKHGKIVTKFQKFRLGKPLNGEMDLSEEQEKHEKLKDHEHHWWRNVFRMSTAEHRHKKLQESEQPAEGEEQKTHEKHEPEGHEKRWIPSSGMFHEHKKRRLSHGNSGRDCVSRTLRHVVESFKRELSSSCESATSPNLIAACKFARDHHFLIKVWLGVRHPLWTKAAEICAASAETDVSEGVAGEGQEPVKMLAKRFHHHGKDFEWTHRNWRISARRRVAPVEIVSQAASIELLDSDIEPKSADDTAERRADM